MVFYNKSMPGEPLFTPGKYNDYKPNTAEIIRGEPPLCPVVTMIIGLTQPQTIPGEPPLTVTLMDVCTPKSIPGEPLISLIISPG